MKKALSLALALVMMLTLAPMTASAEEASLEDGSTHTLSSFMNKVDEEITVAGNATVTVTCSSLSGGMQGAEFSMVVTGESNNFSVGNVTTSPNPYLPPATYTPVNNVASGTAYVPGMMSSVQGITFTITNAKDVAQTFKIQLSMKVGTQSNPEMIDIEVVDGVGTVTKTFELKASDTEYFVLLVAPADGKLGISNITSTSGDWTYLIDYAQYWSDDSTVVTKNMVDVESYEEVMIAVGSYSTDATVTVTFTFEEKEPEPGQKAATALETVVDKTYTNVFNQTYYKYTAKEAGVLTITTTDAMWSDVTSINGEDASVDNYRETDDGLKVQLEKDAVVIFYVYGTANTTTFSESFEVGAELEKIKKDPNFEYGVDIEVGENHLAGPEDWSHLFTVHAFAPGKVGVYTFTTEDALMGIVSTNGMWINVGNPGEEYDPEQVPELVITDKEIVWECTDENQAIWLGVFPEMLDSNITVTWEELVVEEIKELPIYVSSEPYVYTGETSALTYVNVDGKDNVVDKAVYASDGYYHLNDKTGPVLMVNIYDELFSIANAPNTGKVVTTYVDENGKIVKEVWNDALLAYADCADKDTGLYPLTPALVYFYQTYGAQQELFGEDGYVGSQFKNGMGEDAWMFACMYVPNAEDGTIVLPPVVIDPIVKDEEGKVTVTVATEEAVKNIIEAAKEEGKDVVIKTTTEGLTITIANEDLKDATAVKLDVKVEVKEDVKDTTVAKNENITEKNFVLKVEFAHEGKLPAEATIVIPVPEEISKAYKTLYYYQIMEDGTLKFVCDAPINSDGKAVVTQDHCSDYVLLTEKIVEEVDAPKTGDNTNFALWIAVLGFGVVAIAGSVVMKKREF